VAQTWRVTERRQKRDRPPLDEAALERLAIAYAGRYATSRAGLVRYLARKLAERGWAGERPAEPETVAERFVALGYVNDEALAEARARSFARRGLGAGRLGQALFRLGIAEEDRAGALDQAADGAWETALRFAERRRLGPFAAAPADPRTREKAIAAMLRAGHSLQHARKIAASAPGAVPSAED
jgi:regulatory protein